MQPPRSLRQPGPASPNRIDCLRADATPLRITLQPGLTLNQAVTTPMIEAGFQCGTITFQSTTLDPFSYVMPGPPDNPSHVAYFTAPRTPAGISRIEHANATFGWANGEPFIHCHAVWTEPDGSRHGGHILPHETIIAAPAEATAWGFRTLRIDAKPDPETNFTLFQPAGPSTAGNSLLARIKPNEDIIVSIETIAREHGIRDGIVQGSLGSLIGARFTDGGQVGDYATEVLVREGHVRDGKAALHLLVADMRGEVHQGWLQAGENPVCITFELMLRQTGATGAA